MSIQLVQSHVPPPWLSQRDDPGDDIVKVYRNYRLRAITLPLEFA